MGNLLLYLSMRLWRCCSLTLGRYHALCHFVMLKLLTWCKADWFLCSVAAEIGVDPNVILASSHGRRSIDVLKMYDPSRANWDCKFCLLACRVILRALISYRHKYG